MNELKSYTEYAVSTPTADFVIGFDFNYGEDAVNVTVDDVPASEAGYTVVYLNETTIRLSPSVPSGVVRLQRETDIDQTDHAYRAGAKFIAQTMDENFEQLRHSQQEVRDGFVKLADDTYEIIDTLEEVGKSAQDAADAAEVAAALANNAAAQVNDKVSYEDFNNKPHNAMLGRDAASAHPTSSILDASGETQQQVNYNGGSKWHSRVGGYQGNERVVLANGDIVKSTITGNVNDPNVNMTGWRLDDNTVESIADLMTIQNPKDGQVVFLESYNAGQGAGGDDFKYNSNRSSENDGISIFNGWERLWSVDYVTFYHAGAVGDYVTDDEVAIERAQQYARDNGKQIFIAGNFAKSKPFVMRSSDYVTGSRLASRIKKISNATSGLPAILAPEKDNVYDIYDVDALCIFLPWSGYYANHITLRDVMFIRGTYGVDNASDHGLYAPRHSSCETLNLKFDNVLGGFFAKNLFLNRHVNFESVGQSSGGIHASNIGMHIFDGDNIQTGTSNTFERFLFVNYQQAYYISGLQTSKFLCCYGEAISKNGGNDDTQIFAVYNPQELSFENCGLESCYGSPLYIVNTNTSIRGKISIKGWQSRWGANGTLVDRGINLLTASGNVDVVVESSTFHKANEGYINDFGYVSGGAKLINIGSTIGSSVVATSNSSYINVSNPESFSDYNLVKSATPVGNDLNNGAEPKSGLVIKVVNGATLNIPTGLTDVWGTSEYYGLNSTQGTQVIHCTNYAKSYRRYKTGDSSYSEWVEV